MDDVAAAAGVGKGTLYRRFGDRWTLLRALIEEPERDFQDELIRGEPPLGPGAPPTERLRAFGAGQLALLENHARFMFAGDKILAGRHDHPVYAFHRVHLAYLLREILGDDARTDYLVDALLAALAPDLFLYQREVRGMSLEDLIDGWETLADAVVATATARREVGYRSRACVDSRHEGRRAHRARDRAGMARGSRRRCARRARRARAAGRRGRDRQDPPGRGGRGGERCAGAARRGEPGGDAALRPDAGRAARLPARRARRAGLVRPAAGAPRAAAARARAGGRRERPRDAVRVAALRAGDDRRRLPGGDPPRRPAVVRRRDPGAARGARRSRCASSRSSWWAPTAPTRSRARIRCAACATSCAAARALRELALEPLDAERRRRRWPREVLGTPLSPALARHGLRPNAGRAVLRRGAGRRAGRRRAADRGRAGPRARRQRRDPGARDDPRRGAAARGRAVGRGARRRRGRRRSAARASTSSSWPRSAATPG